MPTVNAFFTAWIRSPGSVPGRPAQELRTSVEPPARMKFGFDVLLNGVEPVAPPEGLPGTVAMLVPAGVPGTTRPRTITSNRLMP